MIQATTTTISLASLVQEYTSYNAWANKTLATWLKAKPVALFDQVVPSSYPSLRATLLHILESQNFWLSAVRQTPVQDDTPESLSIEGLLDELTAQSQEFADYVQVLSDEQLQEQIHLKSPWFEANRSRFEYIHHNMNHSTYHRGQLITIGRNLGFTDAPMTDFNFYLLLA
jgi:uncharacterized damage-inducible protein DinB